MRSLTLLGLVVYSATSRSAPAPSVERPITAAMLRTFAGDLDTAPEIAERIPEDQRLAVVKQLIGEGGLQCPRVDRAGCTAFGEYDPPGLDETIRSPCFRRWLVLALVTSNCPTCSIELGSHPLDMLARSRDEAFIGSVAIRLSEPEQLELAHRLKLAGRRTPYLLMPSPAGAALAVGRFHLDDVVDRLTAGDHAALLQRVAFDRSYATEARVTALAKLRDDPAADLRALAGWARPLLGEPSCEVAGAAASIVGAVDPTVVPWRPATRDPRVVMRALCVFGHGAWPDATRIAASYAGASGIERVFDGTTSRVEHVVTGKRVVRHGAETTWAIDALEEAVSRLGRASCAGTRCVEDGSRVEVELAPDADHDLVIVRLRYPQAVVPPDPCR